MSSPFRENPDYEARAAYWLAEANSAREHRKPKREETCLRKCQFWLDRANRASGRGERQ